MTQEQFDCLMAALSVIGNAVAPAQWGSFLVSDGKPHAPAPSQLEVAENPGKYAGTQYDPTNMDITATAVIELFETTPQAFVGGKWTEWYRRDHVAASNYYFNRYKVKLDLTKLAASQRALMGL